jgi:hypothetical protein
MDEVPPLEGTTEDFEPRTLSLVPVRRLAIIALGSATRRVNSITCLTRRRFESWEDRVEFGLLCAETDGVGKFARSLRMRTWEEACAIQPRLRAGTPAMRAAD